MRRSVRAFAPALLWAAAIWVAGGLRDVPAVPPIVGLDKAAHLAMYGVLGWLLGRASRRAGWRRGPLIGLVLLALAFGAADELRQRRIGGRSGEVADWIADAAGVAAGFFLARRGRSQPT